MHSWAHSPVQHSPLSALDTFNPAGPETAKVDSHWMVSECKLARSTLGEKPKTRIWKVFWSWVFQEDAIYDITRSESSYQVRAGPRTETWEMYDKTMMKMRLKWENCKEETVSAKWEEWNWMTSCSRVETGLQQRQPEGDEQESWS